MSQPTSILSVEECFAILRRWQKDGLTEEERDDFVTKASGLLTKSDSEVVAEFLSRVSQAAKLAQEIDDLFYQEEMYIEEVMIWNWFMALFQEEWQGLRERYKSCLRLSCELALDTVDVVQRFESVYLVQVENIQTDQDRLSAIAALESFIAELEKNDKSIEMSNQFKDLKRDVEDFRSRLSAETAANAVLPLTSDIKALDEQIKAAHKSIGVLGGNVVTIRALGLGAGASNVIASLQYHREKKADSLRDVYRVVTTIDKLVGPPIEKGFLDEQPQAPDISKILDNLLVFAEIWSFVRSQSVQFCEILRGGLGAATTLGFKKQVRLARDTCIPLRDGLVEYNRQLTSWL